MILRKQLTAVAIACIARNLVPALGDDGSTAGETPQWVEIMGRCFFPPELLKKIGDSLEK
jgi:hypothetical protein